MGDSYWPGSSAWSVVMPMRGRVLFISSWRVRKEGRNAKCKVQSAECRVQNRRPDLQRDALAFHFAFCILHFTFCTLHFALCTLHSPFPRLLSLRVPVTVFERNT